MVIEDDKAELVDVSDGILMEVGYRDIDAIGNACIEEEEGVNELERVTVTLVAGAKDVRGVNGSAGWVAEVAATENFSRCCTIFGHSSSEWTKYLLCCHFVLLFYC